ncbi:MAG: efflux RND transporter permease subunit [Fibrobacter sp.]|nr:efflux RND transporter permease subunit [Fibrobacter sp.]
MTLSQFSVTRRVTISMLVLIIILFGIISFTKLGLDLFPELEFPILTVTISYPGAAAEDVEELITRPVEQVISTIKGLDKLNSTSSEGMSIITATFDWGTNLDFAGQDIRENISRIRKYMPEGIEDPMVFKFDVSQMPVIFYGVSGMSSTSELKTYLEQTLAPRIERLDGVAGVVVGGGKEREINVYLDKTRLDIYKISPEMVMAAIGSANSNVSSGHVKAGHQEYTIRTMGEYPDVKSVAGTIITVINGSPVRVGDIARVEDTFKEERHIMRLNGKDGVVLFVTKQSGSNTLAVANNIKNLLKELRPSMPQDLTFMTIFDQGEMVEKATGNASSSAALGALLAVLILWLFLRNWRPTLVITLAIPISIITTFIGLYALGYTFNIITIGGFALAVGMLVDNAVVVIENIYRHLELGEHRNTAAIKGTNQVFLAITASTLTTVAVFVPLSLAGGYAGKLARPLSLTICAGLAASLFVAVTIIPMMASVIFKKRTFHKGEESVEAHGGRIFQMVTKMYEGGLRWCLNHWFLVLGTTFILFILSLAGIKVIGGEFIPEGDDGMGQIMIRMPVGTNLDETNRLVTAIEKKIISIPEMEGVAVMIGRIDDRGGEGASDVNEAQIFFRLVPFEERVRSTKQVINEIRQSVPELHDVIIEFPSMGGMGSATSPVELKFYGKELDQLKAFADSAKVKLSKMSGLYDVNTSMREGKPELRIFPDRDKAALMGLSMLDIGNGIKYANLGQVITRYREAGDEYDVRIRLDEADRSTRSSITSLPLISRSGVVSQVGNVGDIVKTTGPITIERENRVRKISVTANTKERNIQAYIEQVKAELKPLEASMPNGYFVEYGGSYKDMQETFGDLLFAFAIAVVLIYMVMAAQFESFSQPFVVMFTVPLAFIGIVGGLMIMGHPLSVPALMGVIILAGIVVNNGIVMISFINDLRKEGVPKREAIVRGSVLRLRPILITSLTTIIGVLPMALSTKQGSEMQSPMGTVVAFGLLTSTLLTLFVVPILYSAVDRISHFTRSRVKKKVLGHTD